MILYCYPKCSTCKKAVQWLEDKNLEYDYIDISKEPPSAEALKTWYEDNDYPLKRFFNTSGLKYREHDIKNRFENMTQSDIFSLLASEGMLIKRPLLIHENRIYIGFKEDQWSQLIK